MAHIELAPQVADDLERILDHLARHQAYDPAARIHYLISAIDVLERNPLIGRPLRGDLRELVIGHGALGYVAAYRYVEAVPPQRPITSRRKMTFSWPL